MFNDLTGGRPEWSSGTTFEPKIVQLITLFMEFYVLLLLLLFFDKFSVLIFLRPEEK